MKKALIAMSGGVDSSVAAYLMKEKGYECIGITIKTFNETGDMVRVAVKPKRRDKRIKRQQHWDAARTNNGLHITIADIEEALFIETARHSDQRTAGNRLSCLRHHD